MGAEAGERGYIGKDGGAIVSPSRCCLPEGITSLPGAMALAYTVAHKLRCSLDRKKRDCTLHNPPQAPKGTFS